jgi:hypothetical protein
MVDKHLGYIDLGVDVINLMLVGRISCFTAPERTFGATILGLATLYIIYLYMKCVICK